MNRIKTVTRTHYTALMLSIIVLSVSGSLILLAFQSAQLNIQAERSAEQIKLLKGIAEEVRKDQQKQHNYQDVRQACFFSLFVTFTNNNPRQPITQDDVDRCRVGADAEISASPVQAPQTSATASRAQPSSPAVPTANQAGQRDEVVPLAADNAPGPSMQPSIVDRLVDSVRNLLP